MSGGRFRRLDKLSAVTDVPDDYADLAELPEQMRVRREKLDRLRAAGADPFMERSPRTVSIGDVREKHGHLDPDQATGERVGVAGEDLGVLERDSGVEGVGDGFLAE